MKLFQRKQRRNSHLQWSAYLFLLPNFLGFLLFIFLPVLASFVLSFLDWNYLTSPNFIGLANYQKLLFDDPQFWRYVGNTIFLMMAIPLQIS